LGTLGRFQSSEFFIIINFAYILLGGLYFSIPFICCLLSGHICLFKVR
jgi:hypothetical protein